MKHAMLNILCILHLVDDMRHKARTCDCDWLISPSAKSAMTWLMSLITCVHPNTTRFKIKERTKTELHVHVIRDRYSCRPCR